MPFQYARGSIKGEYALDLIEILVERFREPGSLTTDVAAYHSQPAPANAEKAALTLHTPRGTPD